MKKIFLTIAAACLLIIISSCNAADEKINVIKGPGDANNSLMISFNELCDGTAEGFLANSDNLLVRRKDGRKHDFFTINAVSKEKTSVFSALSHKDHAVEISPDGKQFIFDNNLVDIGTKQGRSLPEIVFLPDGMQNNFPTPSSYSFTEDNEILLTSPFHYIKKYYMQALGNPDTSAYASAGHISFMKVGEKIKEPQKTYRFNNIEAPDIDFPVNPTLALNDLKYLFIGLKRNSDETPLYVFDLLSKKFTLIDRDVRDYSLSPDGRTLAYVRNAGKGKASDTLFTASLLGEEKKELIGFDYISGVEWSQNNSWIAYSAGEKSGCDIGIIKADGTANEKLTHGMRSTGAISWSASGNRIAFTSSGRGNSSGNSRVYIITLNIKDSYNVNRGASQDPSKKQVIGELLEILKRETSQVLERGTT